MSSDSKAEEKSVTGGWGKKGEFVRKDTLFHDQVPSAEFPLSSSRYHLYVALACPWAHRTLIVRALKGLEDSLPVSVVHHRFGPDGWHFSVDDSPQATGDLVNGESRLIDVYRRHVGDYERRPTVPVLFDMESNRVVNNESSQIIRMLGAGESNGWNSLATRHKNVDLYPEALRAEIDQVNEWIYRDINNGVYRCGFAKSQEAYDEAVTALFTALRRADDLLATRRYLCGDRATEADLRLFVTLIRFDPVYTVHFKCSVARLDDFPHLWAFTKEFYQVPEIAATVDFEAIRRHYYESHPFVNPSGVVAAMPQRYAERLGESHGREALGDSGVRTLFYGE